MNAGFVIVGVVIAALAVFAIGGHFGPRIFGGYRRHGSIYGQPVTMDFFSRSGAERYGQNGLSAIDPYARFLGGRIEMLPNLLARRRNR